MAHTSGTRYLFQRDFKKHGVIPLSTYLKTYRVGDIVDIKGNGAVQKGLPHKWYHGKTGRVFDVTKSSVGVIVYKIVRNKYLEKRVHLRVEHVKHSDSRKDFLLRVKANAEKKKQARETGEPAQLKRQPGLPREARVVSTQGNLPETIKPLPYETYI
ncbi:60S ribosomal protein L21-A [Wickerhamomyces ciferrii]|uniref:60S ribosomal protein L21-A n=1 Tax=Wickerhamomyces ciferrii (strain ATCC 14091 / BCRC 22168 / CBS 111 / JCM 3599 / NBRC 0793 / NRRL Y-1031 F-60-10) TaxID=1206466 RepID=K0KRR4_WICCF|nr:60S ribosomal protein L21-A [Wickerhamomyces ciferrii]CCH44712.1 60S ribosomal protein L21-A [Wickerhamomyces ciferrii]